MRRSEWILGEAGRYRAQWVDMGRVRLYLPITYTLLMADMTFHTHTHTKVIPIPSPTGTDIVQNSYVFMRLSFLKKDNY